MASGVLWTAPSPMTGGTGTQLRRAVGYQGLRKGARGEQTWHRVPHLQPGCYDGSCFGHLVHEDLWAHVADAG